MIPADIRLYTWVDVEEVLYRAQLDGNWPAGLEWARSYWDGLTLGILQKEKENIINWLDNRFDPRFDRDALSIILEGLQSDQRILPITFEYTVEEPLRHRNKPSFSRPNILIKPDDQKHKTDNQEHPLPLSPDLPPVIAFHSFKGGVGRTIHAISLALGLVAHKQDVLLIDGDLEAPGISWLVRKRLSNPSVSLVDFLALIHSDLDSNASSSIELVANRLKDVLVDNIYILPAFRSMSYFTSVEIKPENIIQGASDPYILTEMFAKLGKALNVDAVIIDLRAGLSELSAGLLLDPRVYRVLVTTLSGQSFQGTTLLLDLIKRASPSTRDEEPLPAVIISQVTDEFFKGDRIDEYLVNLSDFQASLMIRNDDLNSEQLLEDDDKVSKLPVPIQIKTPFDPNLLILPENWDDAAKRIVRSNLNEEIHKLIEWLPRKSSIGSDYGAENLDIDKLKEKRNRLADFAEHLVYAEKGKIDDFLTIVPLRQLASDFRSKVPIAVVVGAKGSGKTYTFLQLALRQDWGKFAKDAGARDSSIQAFICPILQSKNLEEPAKEKVQKAREISIKALGVGGLCNSETISDYIRRNLKRDLHEGEWREVWLNVIAWGVGFEINKDNAGRNLVDFLKNKNLCIVAIIDGLEDLFQDISTNKNEQVAIRSLLQEVPEWLEQQPSRSIGLLVFIRQDMVLNAIKQNSAQLLAKYDQYSLKWNTEEALRLVAWIALKSKALDNPNLYNKLQNLDKSELIDELVLLWGRKLGSERSREAFSAEWVIATLTVGGQIQARDLVRLLHNAAQNSINDNYWKDRILVPTAIRGSLTECSRKKIDEIKIENEALKEIFIKLEKLPSSSKTIPFERENIKLPSDQLQALENYGVVIREDEKYYIPEIFRLGLGFKLLKGARPRTLILARRAQKWSE